MKKNDKKIILIIPAYNEEKNISKVISEIKKYNEKNTVKLDYIVINDCSKDNTEKVLLENKANHISLISNLGIGGGLQTGYKYALKNNYDIAIQFDGDGQHDINYVNDLIKPLLEDEYNMVIGSRFIDNDKEGFKSTFARRIGINILSHLIKFVGHQKVYDTTSGFRAVDKKLIKYFASNYPTEYPEPITNAEVLKLGYKIKEVPVAMKERENGVSSIKSWKNCYYMINVILSLLVVKIRRYK